MRQPASRPRRAFPLVVADDASQNALSIFVGTFIFAIVALSATSNDYFGKAGRFTLFVLTLPALVVVVLVFVRWVDSIARLGGLGSVIAKVEQATAQAMDRRKHRPFLGGMPASGPLRGRVFYSSSYWPRLLAAPCLPALTTPAPPSHPRLAAPAVRRLGKCDRTRRARARPDKGEVPEPAGLARQYRT